MSLECVWWLEQLFRKARVWLKICNELYSVLSLPSLRGVYQVVPQQIAQARESMK